MGVMYLPFGCRLRRSAAERQEVSVPPFHHPRAAHGGNWRVTSAAWQIGSAAWQTGRNVLDDRGFQNKPYYPPTVGGFAEYRHTYKCMQMHRHPSHHNPPFPPTPFSIPPLLLRGMTSPRQELSPTIRAVVKQGRTPGTRPGMTPPG